MRKLSIILPLLACGLACVGAIAAPSDDAVKAYRDYVAAIRSGSAETALKLVEPVPEPLKELIAAHVRMRIAIEAVKAEIAKQLNPPKPERGDLVIGELPQDWLKDLVAERVDDQTIELKLRDPEDPEIEEEVGFMLRTGVHWVVSATVVLGLDASPKLRELPAKERDARLKLANAWLAASKSVSERLKKKEFKTAEEAESALMREFGRQAGI